MPFTFKKTPPPLPPGSYKAKIANVQEIEGQFGPRVMWQVDIVHNDLDYRATGYTPATFYDKSKEAQWCAAAMGITFNPDDELDENLLINAPVIAIVAVKPGNDGRSFYNIVDLHAVPSSEDAEPAKDDPEGDVPF
jgi:hypothetical protein